MKTTLRFFYNGIKASDGKLQKGSYSTGQLINFPAGTISIYGKSSCGFSAEVATHFAIQNDSDGRTDFFENDRIRVTPDHPLYAAVKAAAAKSEAHYDKRFSKRQDLYGEVA